MLKSSGGKLLYKLLAVQFYNLGIYWIAQRSFWTRELVARTQCLQSGGTPKVGSGRIYASCDTSQNVTVSLVITSLVILSFAITPLAITSLLTSPRTITCCLRLLSPYA